MKLLVSIVLLAAIAGSCSKSHLSITEATYSGTFQRQTVQGGDIVPVTLVLEKGKYSGNVPSGSYPVICHGTYNTKADSIYFMNECMLTANFDWSLILSGSYAIAEKGDSLIIRRDYNHQQTDIYRLRKQ